MSENQIEYLKKVDSFFENEIVNKITGGKQNPFNIPAEKAIFFLVHKLMTEDSAPENVFIEVPVEEFGKAKTDSKNTNVFNFINFCGAVFAASVLAKYKSLDTKVLGKREKIKPYYSSFFSQFFEFPDPKTDPTGKILIVSKTEGFNHKWMSQVPTCRLIKTDDGSISKRCSGHDEPWVYFSANCRNAERLIREKMFDTIIIVGDRKIDAENLPRWKRMKLFKQLICIGSDNPTNQLTTYYKFSVHEIMASYIDVSDLIPTIEDHILKSICINYSDFNDKYQNDWIIPVLSENVVLNEKVFSFINCLEELREKGITFNFSPLSVYRFISPLSEEYTENLTDRFSERLTNELSITGELNRDEVCDELENQYRAILEVLKSGNLTKIEIVQSIIKAIRAKRADRLSFIHFIIPHKSDAIYLKKTFHLQDIQLIKEDSYIKKFKRIYQKENNKRNIFVFMHFSGRMEPVLKFMDKHSILGTRVFLQNYKNDNRWKTYLEKAKNNEISILSDALRKKVTNIEFIDDLINISELNLNDYSDDDSTFASDFSDNSLDYYTVEFEDGRKTELSGSIYFNGKMIDIEEVEEDDFIHYYQNNEVLFDEIWRKLNPGLQGIETYSNHWINALKVLSEAVYTKRKDMFEALKRYRWNGVPATLTNYLKETNTTLFPDKRKLKALKALCEENNLMNLDFVVNYSTIIKAKNALEGRKKLGRDLSGELISNVYAENITGDLYKKLGSELFNKALKKCIFSGMVRKVTKKNK